MSTIEQRLYDTLSNDANITALTALRIYPVVIPETTDYPCISYQVISGREVSTLNHDLPTLRFKRVQINIWSKKYPEVKTLEDLVTTALYTGEIKGHVENYRDSEDKELKIFGSSVDFIANNYKLSFDILLPVIEYDFKTIYTDYDSIRYFLDTSEGVQNNAKVFTGQGYKPNGVDQTIPYTPIGATHTIYTSNGTMQYLVGVLDLNSVLPAEIYQNVIYFNFDLSQAQKDAYINSPETFLYRDNGVLKSDTLSQAEINNTVACLPMCENGGNVYDLVTATSYPIQNFTNSCRDDAKNLSKGLQTAKWLRDALGAPYGLSSYFEGDGVGYVDTGWIPPVDSDWSIEVVIQFVPAFRYQQNGSGISSNEKTHFGLWNDNRIYIQGRNNNIFYTDAITQTTLKHLIIQKSGNLIKGFIDGIEVYSVTDSQVESGDNFYLMSRNQSGNPSYVSESPIRLFKIHDKALTQEEITKSYNGYVAQGLLS